MKSLTDCAQDFHDKWSREDKPLFNGLSPSNTDATQLTALTQICRKYKIARNLPRKYDKDVALQRYEPLLNLVHECRKKYPRVSAPEEVVRWFEGRIAERYGGVKALSLSSKVLWFVYRNPVLIYDRLACIALGVPPGNYSNYEAHWRESYAPRAGEISTASSNYSNAPWFKDRVFDLYLWHIGDGERKARRARKG